MVKRALWLGSFAAFAHLHCDAAQQDGATQEERADAVKWASEEPGHTAKRFLPGIDYPAIVRRCLERDRKSFRCLFALSAHTDAAASDLQAGILAIVLKQVGDDFFTAQLANARKTARETSIALLPYELLEQTPTPYGIDLKRYPKMMRLLKPSNQAMQRTAGQPALQFTSVCHPSFACEARCIGLALADLVSR
jgi:hypothetical protein